MTHTIYYHADDYGVCAAQSEAILSCHTNGCLNSISIFANSPYTEKAFSLAADASNIAVTAHTAMTANAVIAPSASTMRMVAHLNLIEGHSAAPAALVPLLTDENGMLCCSFGYLLKANFSAPGRRRAFHAQLKTEIAAQLAVVSELTKSRHICVDSHQHFHMIPLVFHALCEVIDENHYILDSLRIPTDPIRPILTTPRLLCKVPPINFIKYGILRALSWRILAKAKRICQDIPVFFGIFFTCRMEYDAVAPLLKKYDAIARKQHRNLELMFHPGGVEDANDLLDPSNKELAAFYRDAYRKKEADTLLRLAQESPHSNEQ